MPLYEYECRAGHRFDRVLPLARYDEPQVCNCGAESRKVICAPMVMPDLPEYRSPIDGRPIRGRRERIEDLKRNNCRPYEDGEKDEFLRRKAQREAEFDHKLDETVGRELASWEPRKLEKLACELDHGITADVVRATPTAV